MSPTATEAKYATEIRARFLFHFRTFLSSTTKPIPALVQRPAAQEPKVIPPARKVSVRTTLDAQLGINPIKQVKKGCKNRLRSIKSAKACSPMEWIITVKTKLTRKMKNATFKVCQMG